jgi:F0F1-type ATP synthase assembly protein I
LKFNLRKTTEIVNQSSKYITLGIEIFVPIVLGSFIGHYFLDKGKDSPLWTIILSIVGFFIGMYNLFKTVNQINKESHNKKNES